MSSNEKAIADAAIAERLAKLRQAAAGMSAGATGAGASKTSTDLLARLAADVGSLIDDAARSLGMAVSDTAALADTPVIDHHGIAVEDLGKAANFFINMLGGRLVAGGINETAKLRSVFVQYPGGGKLELLQPTGDNPMKAHLAKRGEGIHHMTFLVHDLAATLAPLKAAGYRIVDEDLASPTWREAYVSPRTAHGCLVQLVQPGPGYEKPVPGITLDDVLEDRWEWVDQQPRRRA